jgi:hypothetical protein
VHVSLQALERVARRQRRCTRRLRQRLKCKFESAKQRRRAIEPQCAEDDELADKHALDVGAEASAADAAEAAAAAAFAIVCLCRRILVVAARVDVVVLIESIIATAIAIG